MIFIRYENWKSYIKYYPVTCLLILANVLAFIFLTFNGGSTDSNVLFKYGAVTNYPPGDQEWWRLFAAMFLHQGFNHLFSNCFSLLVFAPPLERLMGSFKYLLLYLGSGVIGNVLTLAYYNATYMAGDPYSLSTGASGAVYGVYGAFLFIALLQRAKIDMNSRKTLYSLLIAGIFFSFIMANINWMAHLGGLVGGFLIYGVFSKRIGGRL